MAIIRKCFRCGKSDNEVIKMVVHHLKYNPEEIVNCCQSCHQLIHKRIRRNNECPLSVEITEKLSVRSSRKRRGVATNYAYDKEYNKKFVKYIDFQEPICSFIRLHEKLSVNIKTRNLIWSSYFEATNDRTLFEVVL